MEDNIPAAAAAAALPSGVILVWSGAIANIPAGYVICDGANLTPNLTDKFVAHADADAAGTKNVGDTGGENTHVLSEAELAGHVHSWVSPTLRSYNRGDTISNLWGGTSSENTGSTGSDSAHENRPPYHALAFIMKT